LGTAVVGGGLVVVVVDVVVVVVDVVVDVVDVVVVVGCVVDVVVVVGFLPRLLNRQGPAWAGANTPTSMIAKVMTMIRRGCRFTWCPGDLEARGRRAWAVPRVSAPTHVD
jgi:hypothetical protein